MKYDEVTSDEWWALARRGNKVACCDCNLVHIVDCRLKGKVVEVRFARDERATAALRRGKKRKQS
jgi:hypothetical protein